MEIRTINTANGRFYNLATDSWEMTVKGYSDDIASDLRHVMSMLLEDIYSLERRFNRIEEALYRVEFAAEQGEKVGA